MELNWSTFLLDIVNFLILVWILKRFLYKPVLAAIAQRKAAIDKTLSDATARQTDAQALRRQYENRLQEWESEKEKLRAGLREEISAEREKMMAALQQPLAQEREKSRVVEERRVQEVRSEAEKQAGLAGVRFTARLLSRLASPELELKLVDLALEDMRVLPAEQLRGMRDGEAADNRPIRVTSAFPLPDAQRCALTKMIEDLIHGKPATEFNEDSHLLAGLRVSAGPWVLRANLQDELQFFAEAAHYASANQ